jgi:hypothetical protein
LQAPHTTVPDDPQESTAPTAALSAAALSAAAIHESGMNPHIHTHNSTHKNNKNEGKSNGNYGASSSSLVDNYLSTFGR